MYKQMIVVRNDLRLGKGKIAAQVSHASLESYLLTFKKTPEISQAWLKQGQKKIVLKVESKQELIDLFKQLNSFFPTVLIKDAAHTQLKQPDYTCLGVGPIKETEIDKFTKKYKLL